MEGKGALEKKAVIAMSGGVDSSVAAYLTLQDGYSCIGATMQLFRNEDICVERTRTCCSLDDVQDARRVANAMGMRHYVFNFTEEFGKLVMQRFVTEYEAGRTPNPCIDCNRFLKFERLLERARQLEHEVVVTGHYARIEKDTGGRYLLRQAVDEKKDQSYVLYAMTQDQLAHTLLPLGGMTKDEARAIAAKQGFSTAQKRDSQDICFVPDGDYAAFIEKHAGKKSLPGCFVDGRGNILGQHRGCTHYTIGQRRGIGLSFEKPMYVCDINTQKNEVLLGENAQLFKKVLYAKEINWVACETLETPRRVRAKIRYRQPAQWARAEQTGPDEIRVEFEEPQRAIAPGQAVVLYEGDVVLGGGTIQKT